jgi:hypothetical protein
VNRPYVGDSRPVPTPLLRGIVARASSAARRRSRAIVMHAAWYVGPEIAATQGRLGRSDGCFAVGHADIGQVLARLGRGRLLYAGRSRAA